MQVQLSLGAELGFGTSGKVRAVKSDFDSGSYAVKQVRSQSGAAATSRLRTEAQLHALVGGHPHVVRYHFAWPDGSGGINVLMERCDEELWEFRLQAEGVRLADNARWGSQIAAGLAYIHKYDVIHRDLNPWNVFTRRVRDRPGHASVELKIGDFGLSVRAPRGTTLYGWSAPADLNAADLDESAIGSLFSAPELGSPDGYDFRVDLFSLGQTLAFLFEADLGDEGVVDVLEKLKGADSPAEALALPPAVAAAVADLVGEAAHRPDPVDVARVLNDAASPPALEAERA